MKISRYVFAVELEDGDVILSSFRDENVIIVNRQEYTLLKEGRFRDIPPKDISIYKKEGILVPDDLDEEAEAFIFMSGRFTPRKLVSYIAFSDRCNFQCIYCFEKNTRTGKKMKKSDILRVLKWYEEKFSSGDFNECDIHLWGGEPLLSQREIFFFLEKLTVIAQSYYIKLNCYITTNGYLLTEKFVEEILQYNLKAIHITLDGPQKFHDERRILKGNQKGTYKVIFDNIRRISQNNYPFDIDCRISIDAGNYNNLFPLLSDLAGINQHKNINPYPAEIYTPLDSSDDLGIIDGEERKARIICSFYEDLDALGFKTPLYHTLGPCMLINGQSFLIAPDKKLYGCVDMMNMQDYSIGEIGKEEYNSKYYYFLRAKWLDSCIKKPCPFLPICGGGCLLCRVSEGNLDSPFCRREFLEIVNGGLLKLRFRGEKKGGETPK